MKHSFLIFAVTLISSTAASAGTIVLHGNMGQGIQLAIEPTYTASPNQGVACEHLVGSEDSLIPHWAPLFTMTPDLIQSGTGTYAYNLEETKKIQGANGFVCDYFLNGFDWYVNPESLSVVGNAWTGKSGILPGGPAGAFSVDFNTLRTVNCDATKQYCSALDKDGNPLAGNRLWHTDMTDSQDIQIDFNNSSN